MRFIGRAHHAFYILTTYNIDTLIGKLLSNRARRIFIAVELERLCHLTLSLPQ
jgi:hypothetical protein